MLNRTETPQQAKITRKDSEPILTTTKGTIHISAAGQELTKKTAVHRKMPSSKPDIYSPTPNKSNDSSVADQSKQVDTSIKDHYI